MHQLIALFCFLCLSAFAGGDLAAQRFLQLEKKGTLKVKRYYTGDELVYLLKDEGHNWRRDVIMGLDPAAGIIHFSHGDINFRDITALRPAKAAAQSRTVSKLFYGFALNWGFWSGIGLIVGQPVTLFTGIVIGGAIATGWIAGRLIRSHTIRLGDQRRLRMLDLTIYPVSSHPLGGRFP